MTEEEELLNEFVSSMDVSYNNGSDIDFSKIGKIPDLYQKFLRKSNGGYAQNFYIHFFGFSDNQKHDVIQWTTYFNSHFKLNEGDIIIAEDIFGNPLILDKNGKIYKFWIEDNKRGLIASDFEMLINCMCNSDFKESLRLLADKFYSFSSNRFEPFTHLSFKVPVFLGGADDIANLEAVDPLINISLLGQLKAGVKNNNATISEIKISAPKKSWLDFFKLKE